MLQHHFTDMEQQKEAASMGMWVFLITEIMFFGGMFAAYLVYRYWYYGAFALGSTSLNVWIGVAELHRVTAGGHHDAAEYPVGAEDGRLSAVDRCPPAFVPPPAHAQEGARRRLDPPTVTVGRRSERAYRST